MEMLQIVRADGEYDSKLEPNLRDEDLRGMYRQMLMVRRFNERMLLLQRQGRIGFFIESTGQEACQIGSAFPLTQRDWVYESYRDPGICLVRGVPLKALVDQLMANADDPNKGRQMGVHWGYKDWNIVSLSSPVACRLSQAVGTAYAAKIKKDNIVCLTSFGDGATSQGEFHSAMNFAGVFKVPVIFFCENNQYAISMPVRRQTASENIAVKAEAYGFEGVLVDGNDVLAVYKATKAAVDKARSGGGSTLIEAVTYRIGGHSSSDDPSKYRSAEELELWKSRDPIKRFRVYLMKKGLLTDQEDRKTRDEVDSELVATIKESEKVPAPTLLSMFTDVYAEMPWHIKEEADELARERS
ncbi:MAG: thiamine pyrophosphate-dependent dehydrogenase E1 component subunit alpha [Nitrososphaerales archaeon]|jgi:2-oxoisovalerate dehydrogenase E1 component alpha subunit